MRTVLGSAALCVGGFLVLAAIFTASQVPGISVGVSIASGCLAAVVLLTGAFFLHHKAGPSRRGLPVALAVLGGVVGFAFAVGSKNHPLGMYCGIEGRNQEYTLMVRIFGTVLHEETGPAVRHSETFIGPSRELQTAMACWEVGLDAAVVAAGAFVGAAVGVMLGRRTGPRQASNQPQVMAEPDAAPDRRGI